MQERDKVVPNAGQGRAGQGGVGGESGRQPSALPGWISPSSQELSIPPAEQDYRPRPHPAELGHPCGLTPQNPLP
ncbi:MAG TPA: hypothetical protein VK054_12580 [Beutenbergiaceae bacterium]|nr:hypothetical protein [Beutenbergiaceae bacterium]